MNFDISALTLIDYASLVVLLVSGGLATLRGMTRELMGLIGWPIAIIAAKLSAPYLQPDPCRTHQGRRHQRRAGLGRPLRDCRHSLVCLFIACLPGSQQGRAWRLDRWLGFLFGLIRGFVIVLLVYTGAVVALEGEDRLPSMVAESQVTPTLRGGAHLMSGLLPTDIRDRVIDNLPTPAETTTEIEEAGDSLGEVGASGLELFEDEAAN